MRISILREYNMVLEKVVEINGMNKDFISSPRLGLGPRGGSMSSPRARIALRPELARSGWLDTMTGKSLRKTGRDRQ
jgi:hypothetical protein